MKHQELPIDITPTEWLMSDDTGISSCAILSVMTGSRISPRNRDIPSDPGDFGRCYRLLRHFPEWRARMPEVGVAIPKWKPLVEIWDELTALYEELCGLDGTYRLPMIWKKFPKRKRHVEHRCDQCGAEELEEEDEEEQHVADMDSPDGKAYDALQARMRSVEDACMEADGMIKTGPGSWTRKGYEHTA